MKKIFFYIIIGILSFLLFALTNILVSWIGSGTSIDFTSEKHYTLPDEVKYMVRNIQEPVTFRLYISDDLDNYDWEMASYAEGIVGVLSRYQL